MLRYDMFRGIYRYIIGKCWFVVMLYIPKTNNKLVSEFINMIFLYEHPNRYKEMIRLVKGIYASNQFTVENLHKAFNEALNHER